MGFDSFIIREYQNIHNKDLTDHIIPIISKVDFTCVSFASGSLGILEAPGLEAEDCWFGGCHTLRARLEEVTPGYVAAFLGDLPRKMGEFWDD